VRVRGAWAELAGWASWAARWAAVEKIIRKRTRQGVNSLADAFPVNDFLSDTSLVNKGASCERQYYTFRESSLL
jgi:hypothetical protein